jgi:hypothetical protein
LHVVLLVEWTVIFVGLATELTVELRGVEDALVVRDVIVDEYLVERVVAVIVGRELLGVFKEVLVLFLDYLFLAHGESLGRCLLV